MVFSKLPVRSSISNAFCRYDDPVFTNPACIYIFSNMLAILIYPSLFSKRRIAYDVFLKKQIPGNTLCFLGNELEGYLYFTEDQKEVLRILKKVDMGSQLLLEVESEFIEKNQAKPVRAPSESQDIQHTLDSMSTVFQAISRGKPKPPRRSIILLLKKYGLKVILQKIYRRVVL